MTSYRGFIDTARERGWVKNGTSPNNMAEKRPTQIQVEGLQNLEAEIKENEDKKRKFVMFIGAIDETGDSWCSDCREAEPVVETALRSAPSDSLFILVVVGDRPTWNDPNNDFRTGSYKLTGIPTLIEIGTPKRLGPDECKKQDLVEMFFEE